MPGSGPSGRGRGGVRSHDASGHDRGLAGDWRLYSLAQCLVPINGTKYDSDVSLNEVLVCPIADVDRYPPGTLA